MSKGGLFYGQDFLVSEGLPIFFTQQMEEEYRSVPTAINGEITPHDAASALVKKYDVSAIQAAAAQKFVKVPVYVDIDLPGTLVSLNVVYNDTYGEGASHVIAQNTASTGPSLNVTKTPNSTGKSSSSLTPELIPVIQENSLRRYPGTRVECFVTLSALAGGLIDVLSTISSRYGSTVQAWPQLYPRRLTFVLMGEDKSISAQASSRRVVSVDQNSALITGDLEAGFSVDVGHSTRTVDLPPLLFSNITINNATAQRSIGVTVSANVATINYTIGTLAQSIPGINNEPGTITLTTHARVLPSSVTATTPPTFPTAGAFLYDFKADPIGFDLVHLVGVVVAF